MAGPLCILHVVTSLDPGGMENGVVNLAAALAPHGIVTHVACLERAGAFAARLPDAGAVHLLGKKGGFSPATIWNLHRLLHRLRPDVVHTHNLGPLIYTAGATLFGTAFPLLHGEHSRLTPEEHRPRRLLQRRLLYRACRRVHAVSAEIAGELRELGFPNSHLEVTPNGVDTVRFSPGNRAAARAAFDLPEGAQVLGIVGRFGPYKRHALLLEAFEILAPRLPALHLLLAGAGGSEETAIAERVAASPYASRLRWAGLQAEPAGVYRALDLLVIPSVNEGFSNVALEAMACGTPVLGNTGCGHEQFMTDGQEGGIADLRRTAALVEALGRVLASPQNLDAMGARARETAASRFSLASMADRYRDLYQRTARHLS